MECKYLHQLSLEEAMEAGRRGVFLPTLELGVAPTDNPQQLYLMWLHDISLACSGQYREKYPVPEHVNAQYNSIVFGTKESQMQKPPRFTWSYTAMQEFLTCPYQWAQKRYYKTIKDGETEAMRWGNRLHETAEHYLKKHLGQTHKTSSIHHECLPFVKKYCDALLASGSELFIEMEMCFTEDLAPCGWRDWDTVWVRGKGDVVQKKGARVGIFDWKGLALDTLLPTPNGWSTIGDIQEGDQLFGSDGNVCNVVGKSRVKNLPCYKLVFCDGSEIVCDSEHSWQVGKFLKGRGRAYALTSAEELHTSRLSGVFVDVAQPLVLPHADLPIPPYTFGCWLGDGKHSDGSITKLDQGIFAEIEREGFVVGAPHGTGDGECSAPSRTIYGLRRLLRKALVLCAKHIPQVYFRGSVAQRTALLQGLFDTDGSWNHIRNQVVFTTVVRELADDVYELLCSVGQRPKVHTVTKHGFGITRTGYDVSFTPLGGFEPFRTSRRLARRADTDTSKMPRNYRYIREVLAVPSVATQCLAVDSPDHMFLCGEGMIPTHNSGKFKEDFLQLKIFAWFLSMLPGFENTEEFDPKFIFVKEHDPKKAILRLPQPIVKSDLPAIQAEVLGVVGRMQQAWATENFRMQSNGLCKNYCAATDCPHCGGRV